MRFDYRSSVRSLQSPLHRRNKMGFTLLSASAAETTAAPAKNHCEENKTKPAITEATKATIAAGQRYCVWNDWAYLLLVTILTLFAGLRTSYNDTWNYISAFSKAPAIGEWVSNPDSVNPFKNPLFYFFQSLLKTFTSNPQWLIFVTSLITQICFISFFKRYSTHFFFSIFI